MFAVLAEDKSDFQTLSVLIRRIANNERLPIKGHGFNGGSELLKDGARTLRAIARTKSVRGYVVCHDADDHEGVVKLQQVQERVINASGVEKNVCAVVPVQEIESWILADVNAARHVFGRWELLKEIMHPENQANPKEHLMKLCRSGSTPRYNNATHNQQIAAHVSLEKLYDRCPSFRPLVSFVNVLTGRQRGVGC